jgi:hypothetical protein
MYVYVCTRERACTYEKEKTKGDRGAKFQFQIETGSWGEKWDATLIRKYCYGSGKGGREGGGGTALITYRGRIVALVPKYNTELCTETNSNAHKSEGLIMNTQSNKSGFRIPPRRVIYGDAVEQWFHTTPRMWYS